MRRPDRPAVCKVLSHAGRDQEDGRRKCGPAARLYGNLDFHSDGLLIRDVDHDGLDDRLRCSTCATWPGQSGNGRLLERTRPSSTTLVQQKTLQVHRRKHRLVPSPRLSDSEARSGDGRIKVSSRQYSEGARRGACLEAQACGRGEAGRAQETQLRNQQAERPISLSSPLLPV